MPSCHSRSRFPLLSAAVCAAIGTLFPAFPAHAQSATEAAVVRTTVAPPVDRAVTTPRAFLGFTPGDDCRLANYTQSWGYFHKIAAQTKRMRLIEIGKTANGVPTMLAVISSEENLRKIDRWKTIARTLADGRVSEADARELASEGRVVVWIDGGMHANEVGSAQHTINLGYDLVAREDDEFRRIRDKTIVLLVPSINPDGQNKIADWFTQHYGTPEEGTPLPELYQKYSGHDNNRDWYMLNLPETRNATQILYHDWFPQIVYNHHQAPGMFPERMFVPPYDEPLNANTPPLVTREINALGTAMHERFSEEGKTGVISLDTYSAWWNGGMRTTPWFHNVVGILTEVGHSSPYPANYKVGANEQEATVFYPDPYEGGLWRFADTVAYMNTGSLSLLDWATDHAEEVQLNRWRMAHDAIHHGETEAPFGFVVPMTPASGQRDPNTTALFLERMRQGGLEVRFAARPFVSEGATFPAGTAVLLANQPNRPHLLDMFTPQRHPMRRQGPNGPPIRPYDIAGWTLALQMGVANTPLAAKPSSEMLAALYAPAKAPIVAPPPLPSTFASAPVGGAYLLPSEQAASFTAANRLLAQGIPVGRWTTAHTVNGGTSWAAGTFVIPATDAALAALRTVNAGLRLPVGSVPATDNPSDNIAGGIVALHAPRVATYDPYGGDIPQGWAQFVLEEAGFPHATVTNPDLRAENGLAARCDTLILTTFPNVADRTVGGNGARADRSTLAAAAPATETANKGFSTSGGPDGGAPAANAAAADHSGGLGPGFLGGPIPKRLAPDVKARMDGIGTVGESNLRRFVENGGTLIAYDAAAAQTAALFRLPVRDITKGSKFYSPGSVFRVETEPTNSLCWGLPPEISIFFDRGAAWAIEPSASNAAPAPAAAVGAETAPVGGAFARYPDTNPLQSGWIIEDTVIRGQAAGVAYRVGKGRVVLYGFGVTFRGQAHQGYPLLFNALYGQGSF